MTVQTAEPTVAIDVLVHMLETAQPVTVLDVRPPKERAEWAIPGSLHFDAYEALKTGQPNALGGITIPDDRPVVTVCGAGRMSLTAAAQLRAAGFDAWSLAGGMRAWSLEWSAVDVPKSDSGVSVLQIRRMGKGCLSYLIGDGGEAAGIDASVDPDVYIALARERGWTISRVLDTHIHADHLSRSRALAVSSGASLHLPM